MEQIQSQVPKETTSSNLEKINENDVTEISESADVLDHYRFILLIRNQFLKPNPFKNTTEDQHVETKCKKFKTLFDNLDYHYSQMMNTFDSLSDETKEIMSIYKSDV